MVKNGLDVEQMPEFVVQDNNKKITSKNSTMMMSVEGVQSVHDF